MGSKNKWLEVGIIFTWVEIQTVNPMVANSIGRNKEFPWGEWLQENHEPKSAFLEKCWVLVRNWEILVSSSHEAKYDSRNRENGQHEKNTRNSIFFFRL